MATPMKTEFVFGAYVPMPLKAAHLAKDLNGFRADADVRKLQAGVVVKVDTDGAVVPCGNTDVPFGILVLDAAGYELENCPALASGLVSVVVGGGVYVTDNVNENNIAAGDALYAGTDGVITKTKGSAEVQVGVALTANSATDKTIRFKAMI